MHIDRGDFPLDGHIPEEIITKIRGSQDIVEVISRHISLKKTGQNYIGRCPFHSEKTPSFVVSPGKQIFHCFGCATGGNVITFLMKYESITFPEAVKRLAHDAGIEIAERHRKGERGEKFLYEVNKAAADYYYKVLSAAKEAEPARNYLLARGLSIETMKRFKIGYSMNSWNGAYDYLRKEGFKEEDMVKAGITATNTSGSGCHDRFRGRVMLPICDIQNRVAGFGGRVLDDSTPKYLNSPETPVFSKGHLLYGLDAAKDSIRETGYAILVEGYMDVIALHQAGVTNVVGTLGTAFTINHLRLLNRFCKETVLTFDSDPAGINAALRTMDIFNDSEVKAKVLLLPEGDDPDTFVGKNGKAAFLALVQSAKGIIDFAIDRIIDEVRGRVPDHGGSINSKVKGAGDCLSIIKKISNRIEKDQYIQRVSRGFGIEKEVLLSELRRGNERKKGVLPEKVKETAVERPKAEEILLSLLIRDWALRKMVGDLLRVEDFTNPQFQEIAGHLLRSERDIHEIINSEECNQEIKDTMTKMAVNEMHFDSPEKTLSDCIRALQRSRLEKEFKEVEKEISAAELGGPFERVKELLLKKQELLRQKRVLYEN